MSNRNSKGTSLNEFSIQNTHTHTHEVDKVLCIKVCVQRFYTISIPQLSLSWYIMQTGCKGKETQYDEMRFQKFL